MEVTTISSSLDRPAPMESLSETPELAAEIAEASRRLEAAHPREVIRWAYDRFGRQLTMATAFGPEGCVILRYVAEVAPDLYVFNVDTGYQFRETLELRDRIAQKYGLSVDLVGASESVEDYEQRNGGPVYKTDPDRCCMQRKVTVLNQAIVGFHAWMSGIRRDQSPDRAGTPIVRWDKKFNLVKVSPLATWTKSQVWKVITEEDVPYNPLHDQGYASIGCWPCTRAIQLGEDERAGRWSGRAKTECGLHTA